MGSPRARRRHLLISAALWLLACAVGAVAVASGFAAAAAPLDTLGQFAAPALSLAVLGAGLALALGRPFTALAFAAVTLALVVELVPQWRAPPARAAAGRPIRVYFNNIWTRNSDGPAIRRSIADANADVVALVQVSDRNVSAVRQALAAYPYRLETKTGVDAVAGTKRTVVAARFPIKWAAPARPPWPSQPGVRIDISAGAPIRLVIVHLPRAWPYRGQREAVDALRTDWLEDGPDSRRTVLVGDFNATLSSAALGRLRRTTALSALPVRIGDWPAFLPGITRVGIENALAAPEVELRDRRLALPSGSDHRPIVFEMVPVAGAR